MKKEHPNWWKFIIAVSQPLIEIQVRRKLKHVLTNWKFKRYSDNSVLAIRTDESAAKILYNGEPPE